MSPPPVSPMRTWNSEFGISHISSEAILAHPQFELARRRFLKAILSLYGQDAFLNKLLMETARTLVFGVITILSMSYRPQDRSTWPTLANIKRLTAPFSQVSPRRIDHIIQRLISVNYLVSTPAAQDRRQRLLQPTALFLSHDQDWLSAFYAPLDDLFPDGQYALPLSRDPAFQAAQRQASMSVMHLSAKVLMENPNFLLFATRDAGFLILAQIVLDLEAGHTNSYDQLARRLAVSRTHVRQLLQDAAALQLLSLQGKGGAVTQLTPAGWHCLNRFIADGMSNHDLTGGMALMALGISRN